MDHVNGFKIVTRARINDYVSTCVSKSMLEVESNAIALVDSVMELMRKMTLLRFYEIFCTFSLPDHTQMSTSTM